MSSTIERPTADDLKSERRSVLAGAGLTYEQIRSLADQCMLTEEESAVWDEIKRIDFLLGDD